MEPYFDWDTIRSELAAPEAVQGARASGQTHGWLHTLFVIVAILVALPFVLILLVVLFCLIVAIIGSLFSR